MARQISHKTIHTTRTHDDLASNTQNHLKRKKRSTPSRQVHQQGFASAIPSGIPIAELQRERQPRQCRICASFDHAAARCPSRLQVRQKIQQSCTFCQRVGHTEDGCRKKRGQGIPGPGAPTAIANFGQQHQQQQQQQQQQFNGSSHIRTRRDKWCDNCLKATHNTVDCRNQGPSYRPLGMPRWPQPGPIVGNNNDNNLASTYADGATKKQRQHSRPICDHCQKVGHVIADCRTLQRQQQQYSYLRRDEEDMDLDEELFGDAVLLDAGDTDHEDDCLYTDDRATPDGVRGGIRRTTQAEACLLCLQEPDHAIADCAGRLQPYIERAILSAYSTPDQPCAICGQSGGTTTTTTIKPSKAFFTMFDNATTTQQQQQQQQAHTTMHCPLLKNNAAIQSALHNMIAAASLRQISENQTRLFSSTHHHHHHQRQQQQQRQQVETSPSHFVEVMQQVAEHERRARTGELDSEGDVTMGGVVDVRLVYCRHCAGLDHEVGFHCRSWTPF